MKTIKGIQINKGNFHHWEPLFKHCHHAINHYCTVMDGDDAPYYYTERANISVLAVAGWKSNCLFLQDFSIGKRGQSNGRCDLYFYIDELERQEYIEAKIGWSIGSAGNVLSNALSDAKKLKIKDDVRIGMAFIVPGIHEKHKSDIGNKIHELIDNVKLINSDALAYIFPASTRNLHGS